MEDISLTQYNILAFCALGAEKILGNEIRKLSAHADVALTVTETSFGKVRFTTTKQGMYLALSGLRTADRLFLQCARFPASNFDELFEGVHAAPVEQYIPSTMPIVIEQARTNRSKLAAETSIQSVSHKAVADRLCALHGLRRLPEGDNGAKLRVYIEKNEAELVLDLCESPLHKRGYRLEGGAAPLRETTAASVLLSTGWKRKFPLYDPFCGSGTLIIEAALYAYDIAPNLNRRFALDSLLIADNTLKTQVRDYFCSRIDFSRVIRITGSDHDNTLITMAKRNTQRALNVKDGEEAPPITLNTLSAQDARSFDDAGFVITNPPYGLRLGDRESARDNYERMGVLYDHFPGWNLVIISDDEGFESFFGKTALSCHSVVSGAVKLYCYRFNTKIKNAPPASTEKPHLPPRLKQEKKPDKPDKPDYHWTW